MLFRLKIEFEDGTFSVDEHSFAKHWILLMEKQDIKRGRSLAIDIPVKEYYNFPIGERIKFIRNNCFQLAKVIGPPKLMLEKTRDDWMRTNIEIV